MEKFLHHGNVERVLYCGSVEDCADLLLGIKHYNDSYAVVVWRSSYTMEVWKGTCIILETAFERVVVAWQSSYIVEVWKRSFITSETAFERAN